MKKRPNILLLFTDQQRADAIAAAGNPVIKTPALDRLCAEGMRFANAFTPSPACIPARCSLLFGQYPPRTGCYWNSHPMPTDGRKSFIGALTDDGYRTHGIGKMHFRPDRHALRGFQTRERMEEFPPKGPEDDEYVRFLHDNGFDHVCDPHGAYGAMYNIPQLAQMPPRLHPTQWVGDRSLGFLEEQSGSDQPWFLFTSFLHPHPPFNPPSPWHKLYRTRSMPPPKVPQDAESLQTYWNRYWNRFKYRDQGIDRNLVRCMKAYYYACVSFVDYQVGRILDGLEKIGQADNTLVLFLSDHGEYLGDYNCFGKFSMHDAAVRVPLIARYPKCFQAGSVSHTPVSLVDVAPTILSASGTAPMGHPLDGLNLADVAAGHCERTEVFSQYCTGEKAMTMIVNEQWKYFYSVPDGREYLFDRVGDPEETVNRAGLELCEDARLEMKAHLIDFLRSVGETDILDGDDWKTIPKMELPANPDALLPIQDQSWADLTIPGYSL